MNLTDKRYAIHNNTGIKNIRHYKLQTKTNRRQNKIVPKTCPNIIDKPQNDKHLKSK